jgi:hypothetical protein
LKIIRHATKASKNALIKLTTKKFIFAPKAHQSNQAENVQSVSSAAAQPSLNNKNEKFYSSQENWPTQLFDKPSYFHADF